jgi:flavin-dependent dehydrogenase
MSNSYDVIIVGGGPIGSYTGYQLADKGFSVCILDQKTNVGKDILCTGIVSKEAFKRFDLPTDSILSRIDSFTFIFDEGLLKLASKCGAEAHLGEKVETIKELRDCCDVVSTKQRYRARVVVLATGVRYGLQEQLGMGRPSKFLYGSQVELPMQIPSSTIEIHLGRRFAPGSFGWIAPLNNGFARIGVIINRKGTGYLNSMLTERLKLPNENRDTYNLRTKPIANNAIRQSVKDRILAVGEAAGQVKTTTGGGILYGLLCSEIAVDTLCATLKHGNGALREYEVSWRSALSSELDIGHQLRRLADSLNDRTIEQLFAFVKENRFWVRLLQPRINFDFHSNFLFFCLRSFKFLLSKKLGRYDH